MIYADIIRYSDYLKEIRVLAVKQEPEPVVEDISSSYSKGILDWTAPEGAWTVYRFAYTLIGTTNGPAPPEATGLEVDKLDAGAGTVRAGRKGAPPPRPRNCRCRPHRGG